MFIFLSGNLFAGDKDYSVIAIDVSTKQEGIYVTGNVIVYNSLVCKNSNDKVGKQNNDHKSKINLKKAISLSQKKSFREAKQNFNKVIFKDSLPDQHFSLVDNNVLLTIQNNRERKIFKAVLIKTVPIFKFHKIISEKLSCLKSNFYLFEIFKGDFFCRPPPIFFS